MVLYSKATWIWYPGDFEVWLHEEVCLRRTDRGRISPPFWRLDDCYHSVMFKKRFELTEDDKVTIFADKEYVATLDGKIIFQDLNDYLIPKGRHELVVNVLNREGLPSLYVQGNSLMSDGSWEAAVNSRTWNSVGSWNLNEPLSPPSVFKLATTPMEAKELERTDNHILIDF